MSRAGVIASAAASTLLLAGCGAQREPACPRTVVPAYLPPEELLRLVERSPLPWLLVVNPASGPGAAPDGDYRRTIDAAQEHGARVLGYVPTGWSARPRADAAADAERYRSWYGVDCVFIDEVARGEEALGYYRALGRAARAAGARIVVLNPGLVPARGYFDVADVIVTFEGPFSEYREQVRGQPDWLKRIDPARTAHLIYAASREQAASALERPSSGHVYLTSGTLPHPWGTVPEYFARELAETGSCP